MKYLMLAAAIFLLPFTAVANPFDEPIQEYYVFEVPGISEVGPAFVSWFFIRHRTIWINGEVVNIDEIEWPLWDANQVPVVLVPRQKQKATILIYDENRKLIEEIDLKETFGPEEYFAKAKVKTAFYKLKTFVARNHVELISAFYPWYQKKVVASCELDASHPEFSAKSSRQLKTCISTLAAYTTDDNRDERQFYISLDWPGLKGRENLSAMKEYERDLRSAARKKKMNFLATKSAGTIFRAEVGLTQKELLPMVQFPKEIDLMYEKAALSPDSKVGSVVYHLEEFPDGSSVQVRAFYSDVMAERQVSSKKVGGFALNLQVVAGSSGESIQVVKTRSYERKTGLVGQMRPLSAKVFGAINQLSSSRGVVDSFIGLPGLDLRYNFKTWGVEPYLVFEKQLIHSGSDLAVTELKIGAARNFTKFKGLQYSAGYQEYQLSGRNTGLARLGGISALVLGLGANQLFESYILRQRAEVLISNTQSYAFHFEGGRILKSSTDSRYYVGPFLNYTKYRGYAINTSRNRELFTEARVQLGLSFGWMGSESL